MVQRCSHNKRHAVIARDNAQDAYSKGDFVEISYDSANPDGGCKVKRIIYNVGNLVSQAEGSSSGTRWPIE